MRTGKEGRKLIHSGFIFPAIGLLAFWVSGLPVCAQFHFTEVTAQVPLVDSSCRGTGIHFQHTDGRSGEKYFVETLGSGAAWFDYDQDGDLDIYFVNGADLPEMRSDVPPTNALYRNNGDGSFTDVTSDAGVGDAGYGFGCCAGDYDNDGFSDLYVTNFGQNLLYHNNGDGSFTDMTDEAGVGDSRWGTSAAFADYDNDGDIDLFVANYVAYQLENNPVCFERGLRAYCPPADFVGALDVLYRNNGDGTFTEVTQKAGFFNANGKGLGVVWGDYDNDGYPDLAVANDTTPDTLYRNKGDGTFMEVGIFVGVAYSGRGTALSGMGISFGDYDNDGWLDRVVTNFQDEPNSLHHNDGIGENTGLPPVFADTTYTAGLGKPSLPYLAWGVDFVDLDNDGYLDIFVANGHVHDNAEEINRGVNESSTYAQRNQVFRNRGDDGFDEITEGCGAGLHLKKVSRGAAFGDYDNDGDLDILITNSNQTPDLLRNDSVNSNHWLILETIGTQSNRDGIGARVKVIAGGISQIREVKSGSSYLCQSDMRLHFGLGEASQADLVEIRWPSGLVERFEGVKANQILKAKEGDGQLP